MKKLFHVIAIVLALMANSSARAGIPVIDASNLAQSVAQVYHMIEQLENQLTQITQGQQQINSMTGSRGLGSLMRNPALDNYLPANAGSIISGIGNSGLAGMTPEARAIRQAAGGVYNCSGMPTARDRVLCQARGAMPYQIQALLDGALSIATSRQLQVNALITAINATQDPKSIGELQARIAGEQAALANEQARVQMLAEVARNQAAIEHAQRNEATLRMFSLPVVPAGVVATEP